MSSIRFIHLAVMALAVSTAASLLDGCTTVKDYYQRYTGRLDESGREPTGYYQHADIKQCADPVVIPPSLSVPPINKDLVVPPMPANAVNGPIGEQMDIRAPRAPYRSESGLHTQWSSGEAILWFDKNGSHGIHSEQDAWILLGKVLKSLDIKVGEESADNYELTIAARDFNEFGQPYSPADLAAGAPRYRQIYRLRIGRNYDDSLGIATQMIGSMTMLSSGYLMPDLLDPIELQRFAMGFSNHIIHVIDDQNRIQTQGPQELNVILDTDKNGHACFVVDSSYEMTMNMLRDLFPRYEWVILEDSVNKAYLKLETEEEDADFYHERGVDSFALEDGEYYVRVGIDGDKSIITFYDDDDMPLPQSTLSRIYSGFSQALIKEFENYSTANVVKVTN